MAVMGMESQRATTSQPPGTNGDGEKQHALVEEAEKPSQYISKEMITKTIDALDNPLMRVMTKEMRHCSSRFAGLYSSLSTRKSSRKTYR